MQLYFREWSEIHKEVPFVQDGWPMWLIDVIDNARAEEIPLYLPWQQQGDRFLNFVSRRKPGANPAQMVAKVSKLA